MTARKPAPTHEPWQQHETDSDQSIWLKPVLVATLVFSAGFVWFIGRSVQSHSGFGQTIVFLLNTFAVMLLLGAIAIVPIGVYAAAQRARRVLIKPDGRFPMRYTYLDAPEPTYMVVDRSTRANLAEKSRALPPGVQSVSQSQSTSTFDVGDETPLLDGASDEPVVTWAMLESAGEIGGERPPFIGIDMTTGDLVRLDWEEGIGSLGIYGRPRSGKTVLGVVLAMQAIAAGGKLIVCDRHMNDRQSFTARMGGLEAALLRPVARTDAEIIDALRYAYSVLEQRMAGDEDRSLVIVIGEELTALFLRLRDEVEPLLGPIVTEGRKFGVNAWAFAQAPQKEYMGIFKDASMSAACFRHSTQMGRIAMSGAMSIRDLINYPPGHCCFAAANGEMYEHIRVPEITPADVVAVTTTLSAPEPAKLTRSPLHLVAETGPDGMRWGMSLDDDDQFTPEEELRVVQLYKLGKSTQQIVQAMRGVPPGGTRRYRKLRDAVEAIIRVRLQDAEEGNQ